MGLILKQDLINVEQYHKMFEEGILTERDKTELIHGNIITMSPKGSRHNFFINRLNRLFGKMLGDEILVCIQNSIQLDNMSEPEPDVVLCMGPEERYWDHNPSPKEVFLVVEVAHSSLTFDKKIKIPLYAQSGIPEVWIIDVEEKQLIVAKNPQNGKYKDLATFKGSDTFECKLGESTFPIFVEKIFEKRI